MSEEKKKSRSYAGSAWKYMTTGWGWRKSKKPTTPRKEEPLPVAQIHDADMMASIKSMENSVENLVKSSVETPVENSTKEPEQTRAQPDQELMDYLDHLIDSLRSPDSDVVTDDDMPPLESISEDESFSVPIAPPVPPVMRHYCGPKIVQRKRARIETSAELSAMERGEVRIEMEPENDEEPLPSFCNVLGEMVDDIVRFFKPNDDHRE